MPMTRQFKDRVPVNAPLLLYNGSAAYDTRKKEITFCHEIHEDLWELIPAVIRRFPDMTVEVQGIRAHYRFQENPAWDALCDSSLCARAMAHPGDDLGPFMKFALYGTIHTDEISDMFRGTPEELRRMDQVQQALTEELGDRMEVFRSAARILDVHAKGVSKNRSAQELKAQLGKKLLVCVGDGENDVSMLDGADYAFCPGDSVVSDRYPNVCSCGEGAVADVIYRELPKIISLYT